MPSRRSYLAACVVAVLTGVGCSAGGGGSGAPLEVRHVETHGDVPTDGLWTSGAGGMVGARRTPDGSDAAVVVSHDGGRTWSAVELPGRPARLDVGALEPSEAIHGDARSVAVVGRDPRSVSGVLPVAAPEFHVWVSTDLAGWRHDVLPTRGGAVGAPGVTAAEDTLLAWSGGTEGFVLHASRDAGASWSEAPIAGLSGGVAEAMDVERVWAEAGGTLRMVLAGGIDPTFRQLVSSSDGGVTWTAAACDRRCASDRSSGLLVRPVGEVSTDGGSTWRQIDVDPPPPAGTGDPPHLRSVVDVPGGWLAAASSEEASDVSYGQLLRSEDGISWRQLLPSDPCHDADVGRPNSHVGVPVRVGDRWYVTYDCSDLSTPVLAQLYTSDLTATSFDPVETRRDGVRFGEPVEDDDRLLFPEVGEAGQLTAFTVVDPTPDG